MTEAPHDSPDYQAATTAPPGGDAVPLRCGRGRVWTRWVRPGDIINMDTYIGQVRDRGQVQGRVQGKLGLLG